MNFEEMMKELRTEYVATLPQKMSDVQAHYTARSRDVLRDDFHKMKGTGKTYGIPEISELGEVVEKLCLNDNIPIDKFIPTAIKLLEQIHASRLKDAAYDLSKNTDFASVHALLK